jgi:hypothetical protein
MIKIPDRKRHVLRRWSLAAAAMVVLSIVSSLRVEALPLIGHGATPPAKSPIEGVTEVRWNGGGHGGGGGRVGGGHVGATFHGGGGFRGPVVHSGGFRSVAPAFRSGGFRSSGLRAGVRAAPAFHGGGLRYGGQRYGGYRRHFHRGYAYGPAYYDEPSYYYYPRQCRIVWTYHGPRRVCHYRHWHRRYHHRHYHHRRHHFGFRFVW